MRMRQMTSLLLALTLLTSLSLPAHASGHHYHDVGNHHYAAGAIETWSGRGVLQGSGDGAFRPDDAMTRAELAAVLDRVMGYQDAAENTFADLPEDAWYTGCMLRLAHQGVFHGDEACHMRPEAPITRQEAFTVLARMLALEESGQAAGFADDGDTASWARGCVSAMREAGYIQGDQSGCIHANVPITRAEVVTILDRMAAGFVSTDGTYSQDCHGSLFVNAKDVRLKNMTVEGDLIVTDGVGNGDVYLDNVTVQGDVILRGCGENSFHILPGCQVENIIVTKTTDGMIRLVNQSGKTIPMIYIEDGRTGVTLEGGTLGSVVVNCDTQVVIKSKRVDTVSVVADAKVTVEKGTTVSKLDVGKTAENASLTIRGSVSKLTNDANVPVDRAPALPSGGSSGGGGGGSSTPNPPPASPSPSPSVSPQPSESPEPSESPAPTESPDPSESPAPTESPAPSEDPQPTEIAQVNLQLLAPVFSAVPDTADVLDVGYTAQTQWFNAGGDPPSYRWKPADSDQEDTFTAGQSYQARIVLSPISGYRFAEDLTVRVTDGKNVPTLYTPAKVESSGEDRVVTMLYGKTEDREPVSGVGVEAPEAVNLLETPKLTVFYWNNCLVDPATFAYQWYRCDDANGNGQTPIPNATAKEYTVPAEDTQAPGTRYYRCEMTILGESYLSSVKAVEIRDALDPTLIPTPVLEETPVVRTGGRWADIQVKNLLRHKDVSYQVSVSAQATSLSGADLAVSGVSETIFDSSVISEDGTLLCPEDLIGHVNGYVSILMERDMAFRHDVCLSKITVTVTPLLRKERVEEKAVETVFDMSDQAIFYIHDYETPDELWQGPSRDMKLLIQSAWGTPQGKLVDKDDHTVQVAPKERYQYVDTIFGLKGGNWKDGNNARVWDETVFIWNDWLTGLSSGSSSWDVRCAFYADNAPDGGMNVYYVKLTLGSIILDLENS